MTNMKNGPDQDAGGGNASTSNGSYGGKKDNRHGLSIAFTAIILVLFTVSARSVNNMVVTSVPILSRYVLGFSNLLVGVLTAVIYVST
ncbi:MAG: hypothetical protein QW597_04415, partial [Thermoplasmataceae archaeon]